MSLKSSAGPTTTPGGKDQTPSSTARPLTKNGGSRHLFLPLLLSPLRSSMSLATEGWRMTCLSTLTTLQSSRTFAFQAKLTDKITGTSSSFQGIRVSQSSKREVKARKPAEISTTTSCLGKGKSPSGVHGILSTLSYTLSAKYRTRQAWMASGTSRLGTETTSLSAAQKIAQNVLQMQHRLEIGKSALTTPLSKILLFSKSLTTTTLPSNLFTKTSCNGLICL